jgi:uncharacterized protein (DUF1697 family)
MPRYVAFLRGVSPLNARMPELKRCFESAGFSDVRTLLSSGNVVFSTRSTSIEALQRKAEKAMLADLGRSFTTFVRPSGYLQQLLASEPFAGFELPPGSKQVVTFLRRVPEARVELPITRDNASILKLAATEVYCAYVPGDKGPVFMQLLERTFGSDITTRTMDTVRKCAVA